MNITKVELLPINPKNGLIAFACVEIDSQFYVSSIGVHKKLDGTGYRVTYPTKKIGEQHLVICHPTKPGLSKEIEEAIFEKVQELFG
ncbi:MAG: septation protein SpoVG family protein [Candidatus Neptunochlamydia sp.]|jgi:stage V sporulation protein G|nr:septation protein SpoVG family protein [Candidatus Neptunochlamydia sp.]